MSTIRSAIYVRVSTDEQAGAGHVSLDVQADRCREYVAARGGTVVALERDQESGLRSDRAGYQRVLAMARAKAIDAVVVHSASRFGRRASEVLSRVEELRGLGVELLSTAEDLTSFLMLGIQAVLNEEETRRILERTMPAKYRRSEQGYRIARAPFGTINDKGILRPGPDFDLVRLAFELCAGGEPIAEISRRLNNAVAPRVIGYAMIMKTLRNASYVGRVKYGHVLAAARWDPLIEPAVFEAAQLQIAKRYVERRQLTRSYPYWILGMAFCRRCGARMHPKVHVMKWGRKTYPYVICGRRGSNKLERPCRGPYVDIEQLQDWVIAEVSALAIDADEVERYLQVLAGEGDEARQAAQERRRSLALERERLERRLLAAKAAHLDSPETYSLGDVKQIQVAVRDSVQAINQELLQPAAATSIDIDGLRRFLLDRTWLEVRHTDPAGFRQLLQSYIARVDVGAPGEYSIAWAPVMAAIELRAR